MQDKLKKVLPVFLLCAALLATILFLFAAMRASSLQTQVKILENQVAQKSNQVKEYRKSYCSNQFERTQVNTTTRHTMTVDGVERSYRVHTPKSYDASVRYPVILNFDGVQGSGARMEKYSNIDSLPVIAVYPDSLKGLMGSTAWQGAPYSRPGSGDVKFVQQLVEDLPSQYCVDSARTFAVGMSNGGGFALLVACEMPGTFKAIATVSGAFYRACPKTPLKSSLLIMHSTADKHVPFQGSQKRKLPQVLFWTENQAKNRECRSSTQNLDTDEGKITTWYDCKNNVLIRLVVVNNQSHGWLRVPVSDTLPKKPNAAEYIWKYFENLS